MTHDDGRIVRAGWTWPQRLERARDVAPSGAPAAPDDWRAWRHAVDPHDEGLFARRLAWDGLSEAAALSMLAGPAVDEQATWMEDLTALREAIRGANTEEDPALAELPFAALLSPMVAHTWNRLGRDPAWGPSAQTALRRDLGRRLAEVGAAALFADFSATRPQGVALQSHLGVGRGGDRAFRAWCRARSTDGLDAVLQHYPVLGRLLAVTTRSWQQSTADLLERVQKHRPEIAAVFGIPVDAPISDIRPGLSDPHRGGHSVAVLDFASGDPLVYKPKDLRLEQHFQRLVAGVNRHFPDHPLHEVQVLPGDGPYGFTSFVAHRPCPREQLPGFYVAAGRLLALLYLLGATDAHHENVIAAGSSPALIDSETLFHTDTSGEPTGMLSDSVLRTGLLPGWLLIGPQQEAYDPSALGVSVPEDAAAAPGWAHVNTDDMIWTRVPRQTSVPPSLPVDDPADNPLPDHVEHLVAGYRDIHLACAEPTFRDMLLDSVTGCRGLPQRLVLRSTRIYGVIGQRALSARALTSANARAFELERLSRVALVGGERDPAWAVFQAELHDMENLDVPYFEHELGCDVVVGALGPISGLVTGDATRVAAERILALDAGELSWQEHLIRGSVRARFLDADQDTAPPATRQAAPLAPTVPALLATIERAAVRRQAGAPPTWLTLSLLPDGKHLQLGTVGDGWYDGRAGIAAVQGWAATCGDDPALTRQAAQTGEPVLERLRHADPHTRSRYLRALGPGATGVGGLLRWLAPGDREHLLADVPASLIKRDRTYDVIGGVAGLIGPLAAAQGFPATGLLTAAAEHLAAGQLPNGGWPSRMGSRPLTGLAHGAAGCGLALLQAGAVLGRTDLVDAGAAAFDYEARLYDEQLGNWPDFRDQRVGTVPMVAWCHGAAGIGLSRVRALQILPEHPDATTWQEHLRAAMTTTATAPPTATDHLCCGLTGRAAVLRIAGRAMAEPQWLAAADDLTTVVADRCAATGRFRLPMDIPGRTAPAPGLMTGVAGIAAHLLSLSVHDDLSALLL